MPSILALETAAEWLDMYEGEPGDEAEAISVHEVADWLRKHADAKMKREATRFAIERIAAENGVTSATVRAALATKPEN